MSLTQLIHELDDNALLQFFSSSAVSKGRSYVGRVGRIEVAGHTLTTQVKGSDPRPYRTTVRLERRGYYDDVPVEIATRCTCPVGNRCKHAVALLLAARRQGALVEKPREIVLQWVSSLRRRLAAANAGAAKKAPRGPREAIRYAIRCEPVTGTAELDMYKGRVDVAGTFSGRGEPWFSFEQALLKPPAFVVEADLAVFRQLRASQRRRGRYGTARLAGPGGLALLQAVLATGRAFIAEDADHPLRPLAAGAARPATLDWQALPQGVQARLSTEPAATLVLPTEPLWYLDALLGEAGPAEIADQAAVRAVLDLPPLSTSELPVVAKALANAAPALPTPLGAGTAALPVVAGPLRPTLFVDTLYAWQVLPHRGYPANINAHYDFARATFGYGDVTLPLGSTDTVATLPNGDPVRLRRQPDAEKRAMSALAAAGFQPIKPAWVRAHDRLPDGILGLACETDWQHFFASTAPALRAAGWRIESDPLFRHRVNEVAGWFADLAETESGWFELSLGIEVEGRRVDLAPMLHELFRKDRRWLDPRESVLIPDNEVVTLHDADGSRIQVTAQRLKPLAATLVDLFDAPDAGPRRLSRMDAPRIDEALGEDWQRAGFDRMEGWLRKIRRARNVRAVEPPAGFGGELRPYQREGLAWLQHLREHELGGILADDMGLGKTAQALAHLLTEKQAGRLDRPALVVLPTSLVFNWAREAARFAPALSVLRLHGKDRAAAFERIPEHDVCLTTYPLLWRDREALGAHAYHLVILDEAQTVKNAASQAAQVVRELTARHRLCITGTPLENHLGELWSQFDFLLPGFLGTSAEFTARWRTPIEKHGDGPRRDLLAKRVAPFILRRTKEEVAKELPPKTIMVRSVEIEGDQRDLYEAVRSTMDQRIRDEIAARGIGRSQIVILDAMLKLRQVCCDPRLVKNPAAAKVQERAKLELLMDMLPELVDEGRKVLVFSQFTEMLSLIEKELEERGLRWTKLTGQTRKREEAIARFQDGEVPIFLISLKAGGVGLNLTAADTVIHYDPWWNPAAENQATDRAHRIGQTKNVFVYKLIVAGSIEERILALQERKAGLAAGVLSEDADAITKFGAEDIDHLLAPLPED